MRLYTLSVPNQLWRPLRTTGRRSLAGFRLTLPAFRAPGFVRPRSRSSNQRLEHTHARAARLQIRYRHQEDRRLAIAKRRDLIGHRLGERTDIDVGHAHHGRRTIPACDTELRIEQRA